MCRIIIHHIWGSLGPSVIKEMMYMAAYLGISIECLSCDVAVVWTWAVFSLQRVSFREDLQFDEAVFVGRRSHV